MTQPTNDWRVKLANEVRPGRPEIERAFAEQAYSFIKAKAGALMDDSNCLGFELIHSNDDNTRIIGAFVFRVADALWLAPVFFLNGQIKGDQFLWDCKRKLFKPLCTEWAEKIIRGARNAQSDAGRTMPRAEAERHSGLGYDLNTIARQPHSLVSKTGAFKQSLGGGSLDEVTVANLFTTDETAPVGVLTRKYLKTASAEMVEAMIGGLEGGNTKTAELLLQFTDGDVTPYTDALADAIRSVKIASTTPALTFRCGNLSKTANTAVSNVPHVMTSWKHAFEIEDPRNEDEKVKMVQTDVVFENLSAGQVIDIPIMGEVTLAKVYVAAGIELHAMDLSEGYSRVCEPGCGDGVRKPNLSLYFLDDKTMRKVAPGSVHGVGKTDEMIDAKDVLEKASVEPKVDGIYHIAIVGGNAITTLPVLVVEIDRRTDNYSHLRVVEVYDEGSVGCEFTVLCDKTRASDLQYGIIGRDAVFLECAMTETPGPDTVFCSARAENYPSVKGKKPKESPVPLPAKSLFDIVMQNNGLQISVTKGGDRYKMKVAGQRIGTQHYELDHPVKLAAALCLRVGLSGEDAMSVIYEADNCNGAVKFATIAPTEKTAATMTSGSMMRGYVQREPNWNPNFDSYNNVLVDWPREFQTQVSQQVSGRPSMDNNEMMQLMINEGSKNAPSKTQDPDILPFDELMQMQPSDIEKAIADRNLLHAVEHGVIAQLVRTYDVGRVITDLIPDIEIGVDRIGRLLFLFYWKPSDFEKLYGSDELVQRETQLSGTFRSMGLLVLDLLKRPIDANGASQSL